MTIEQPGTVAVVGVRAVVAGRVQGVWFRESCRREAERLGVDGWVRNLADGRVELEAWGRRTAVDELLTWAHEGPRLAVVESVTVEDRAAGAVPPPPGFVVR